MTICIYIIYDICIYTYGWDKSWVRRLRVKGIICSRGPKSGEPRERDGVAPPAASHRTEPWEL